MKILIYNNTMGFHCGSTAVMEYLLATLGREGHQAVGLVPNVPLSYAPFQAMLATPFDALVINGEGTMHHDTQGARRIAEVMQHVTALGKKVYLVNSLWEDNTCVPLTLLNALNGLGVREICSAEALNAFGYSGAKVSLDFSYFRELTPSDQAVTLTSEEIVTDFYVAGLGFVESVQGPFQGRQLVRLKDISWSDCVDLFSRASLVLTGRHHAVYAACRARVPFAVLDGNSHKIRGLIKGSGIDIPVARMPKDFAEVVDWARQNRDQYERLFDWMEAQPRWSGLGQYQSMD
jgi:hypothetical protein